LFLFSARLWQLAKRKLQLPPVTVRPQPLFLPSGRVWQLAKPKLQLPRPETPLPHLVCACDVLQATQRVIRPGRVIELAQRSRLQARLQKPRQKISYS
jgi:hypothetical protein